MPNFFRAGMKAQWEEGGGRVLLGDNKDAGQSCCGKSIIRVLRILSKTHKKNWDALRITFLKKKIYIFTVKCINRHVTLQMYLCLCVCILTYVCMYVCMQYVCMYTNVYRV